MCKGTRLDVTDIIHLLFCSGGLLERAGDGTKHSLVRHVVAVVVIVIFAWVDVVRVVLVAAVVVIVTHKAVVVTN